MSFAYKKISQSDISIIPYKSNKSYSVGSNLSGSGIISYVGVNNPPGVNSIFNPISDSKTSNNEYKRLIFSSVKHLFYKNYIENNGLFISSSIYEDYPQTTLYSGSYVTNLRNILNRTGSSQEYSSGYDIDGVIYDDIFTYDETPSDSIDGNLINVISIDKNIYSSNIQPNSFEVINSSYYVRDDGEGNIFDYGNKDNYTQNINTGLNSYIYVGNIFYSMGLIIITNPDYICLIETPPSAVDDYISYLNINQLVNFDILGNDRYSCGGIDYSSIELIPIEGKIFPDSYIGGDSFLYITPNQQSYIPGIYQIGYTVATNNGTISNIGLINLEITSTPLEINNLYIDKICTNDTGSENISYSFNINNGVPQYSYSFDNINYIDIEGFNNIYITGSTLKTNNILYVKDYIGSKISSSFDASYNIDYTLNITQLPFCDISGGILNISSSNGINFTIDNNEQLYNTNENILIPSGNHELKIFNDIGCFITASYDIYNLPSYSYNIISQSTHCGENNGIIEVLEFNGTYSNNILVQLVYPNTSSSIYNISSSLLVENLPPGTYSLQTYDGYCSKTSSVLLLSDPILNLSSTVEYFNECGNRIELIASGGISPYTYQIISSGGVYNSDNNIIELFNDGISSQFITASVIDSYGCVKTIYPEIYGREYIYSGSYCEQN